jgi:hypothetical protein
MKKTLTVALALGLVVGALVAPVEAKKKKAKPPVLQPAELKYFLHWEADGSTPEGCTKTPHMDLKDTEGDTTCSFAFQIAQEAFAAAGQDLLRYSYPATEGVPFVLDASRHLTGQIALRGTVTKATVEVVLTGVVNGEMVTLAEGVTAEATGAGTNNGLPGQPAIIPVDFEIAKGLDKAKVTGLTLGLTVRGVHRGWVDYEVTPTHVIVPAWK